MSYFRTCPHCGAALDPGEVCTDCRAKEGAPASASNAGEGGVEQNSHAVSASTITENGGFVK
mgnify:CR=1 FL=1|jgi:hypothetical protein